MTNNCNICKYYNKAIRGMIAYRDTHGDMQNVVCRGTDEKCLQLNLFRIKEDVNNGENTNKAIC
jgi:hypothetical protein